MAYIIYNNDGTVLSNIADGDVDSNSTSLDLIGKNVNNYGQFFNNDLVKLLTSFAAPTGSGPRSPQIGQLWYDTTLNRLTIYDGIEFNPTYGATVSGTEPITTSTGDIWYDTVNSQLRVWTGSAFKLVAPEQSAIYGKFGISTATTTIREDDTNLPQKVGVMYSYGNVVGLVTTSSFSMSAADATTYLSTATTSTVVQGITAINDMDVKGDLYIGGIKQIAPVQTLTVGYFNITPYLDPADVGVPEVDTQTRIENGNIAIRDFLPSVFSTASGYNEVIYPTWSDAKVVCYYNATSSVRRFRLIDDPLHAGVRIWHWYDVYPNTFANTLTNIVVV
jgi:hypothetical protein